MKILEQKIQLKQTENIRQRKESVNLRMTKRANPCKKRLNR